MFLENERNNIKQIKENDGEWTIYDSETMVTATIIKIEEYSIIPEDEKKDKYRVDFKGKTIESMIKSFENAKKKAVEVVKNM